MKEEGRGETKSMSFFSRWIYPLILVLIWGIILGIVLILLFQESISVKAAFTIVSRMAAFPVICWVLLETPLNVLVTGILYNIVYGIVRGGGHDVGTTVIFPAKLVIELCYFVFLWPVTILNLAAGIFLRNERYTLGRWTLRVFGIRTARWRDNHDIGPRLFSLFALKDEALYTLHHTL
ncbi:hypothetical protein JW948_15695 [bacterium]|nr:hypothetical protein [bacterium]